MLLGDATRTRTGIETSVINNGAYQCKMQLVRARGLKLATYISALGVH